MLSAKQSFNNNFFAGIVLRSIFEDTVCRGPKLKASGPFRHLDKAGCHLTCDGRVLPAQLNG
jgi:hypothetical protein